jgi:hypothetical protein
MEPRVSATLKEMVLSIPRDVSVAATTVVDVPDVDTGINQNSEQIGWVATETLISLINTNDRGKPDRIPSMMRARSCRACRPLRVAKASFNSSGDKAGTTNHIFVSSKRFQAARERSVIVCPFKRSPNKETAATCIATPFTSSLLN